MTSNKYQEAAGKTLSLLVTEYGLDTKKSIAGAELKGLLSGIEAGNITVGQPRIAELFEVLIKDLPKDKNSLPNLPYIYAKEAFDTLNKLATELKEKPEYKTDSNSAEGNAVRQAFQNAKIELRNKLSELLVSVVNSGLTATGQPLETGFRGRI